MFEHAWSVLLRQNVHIEARIYDRLFFFKKGVCLEIFSVIDRIYYCNFRIKSSINVLSDFNKVRSILFHSTCKRPIPVAEQSKA